MILSSERRFVFMHVPKCAGTTVRQQLIEHVTPDSRFLGGLTDIAGVGTIDTAHIPLRLLRNHFPDVWDAIQEYESFAILRDPFQRFPASLFQRLRMYGGTELEQLTPQILENELGIAMDVLNTQGSDAPLPYDFIHFQPQATYVELDGRRIIEKLFAMNNLKGFYAAASQSLEGAFADPQSLQGKRTNQSQIFKSARAGALVTKIPTGVRYPLLRFVPLGLKSMLRSAAYQSKDKWTSDVLSRPGVIAFIENFYDRDIELYREASKLQST